MAWKKLTTSEFNQARTSAPSRPYWHLRWLHALLQSNGRLAAHLDPGGTYRLKEQVFIEPVTARTAPWLRSWTIRCG
jgi:hypothetical protein